MISKRFDDCKLRKFYNIILKNSNNPIKVYRHGFKELFINAEDCKTQYLL